MVEENRRIQYMGNRAETGEDIKSKWWDQDDDRLYASVFAVVSSIEENQKYREVANLKYARLYNNCEILGLSPNLYARTAQQGLFGQNRITLNVVKSTVDTLSAKINGKKPKPLFLTNGGDYKTQKRAKKLTQYVNGQFEALSIYRKAQTAGLHAGVFGTGVLYLNTDGGEVNAEHVFSEELRVDDAEAIHGEPNQIHRVKYVSRDTMCELYPDDVGFIKTCSSGQNEADGFRDAADFVKVIESWHLPSGPKAKDGKHAISIDNKTLFSESYNKKYLPFVKLIRSEKLMGWWGTGLAEELIGIQYEINTILKNIQASMKLVSVPRIFLENASQVNSQHINNQIGAIVKYTGQPPVFSAPPAMSPDVYAHLENLYKKAFEITGISLLSATSKKPGGLDSAVALREYQEIETERFILYGQRWNQFFLDIAKIIVDLSRDLYEQGYKPSVKAKDAFDLKGRKFIGTIDWKDVDLDDDQYIMQLFEVSGLPSSPAGRLQAIQEFAQAGYLSKEEVLDLLDFPDLKKYVDLATANTELIQMQISSIVEDGIYEGPDEYQDLQLSHTLAQKSLLLAKQQKGMPEEHLDLLRTYIQECQDKLNPPPVEGAEAMGAPPQLQPGAVDQSGGLGGAPAIAQGAPPPVSQLMPIGAPAG